MLAQIDRESNEHELANLYAALAAAEAVVVESAIALKQEIRPASV